MAITLAKTHKPLHTMTDSEVSEAVRAWERVADDPRNTPAMREWRECMIDVFNGELLRRVEHSLRTLPV